MRDDEKMFNIGTIMLMAVVFLIVFLQVCYRVQTSNLDAVCRNMDYTRHEFDFARNSFS